MKQTMLACGAILALASAGLVAQNPMTAAPRNYKLEIENESVRVIRSTLSPGDNVPVHQHPTFPTVYVYLTDGGPAKFVHTSPAYTANRGAVRAGAFRFNGNAHEETHSVEYLGTAPSEYLRVELKTTPDGRSDNARFSPEDNRPYENKQVRVSRHECAAGATCAMPQMRAVVVRMNDRVPVWYEPGAPAMQNTGSAPLKMIWIELKTSPAK